MLFVVCVLLQEPLRLGTESKPTRDVTVSDSGRKLSTDSTNVSLTFISHGLGAIFVRIG